MAAGNVYVFNTTQAQMLLILNNMPISTQLSAVTQSGGYAPTSVSVARNTSPGNPGTNQFGGQNVLIVTYPNGGGTSQQFNINISATQNPIGTDLQLYLFYNIAVLETGGGQGSSISGSSTQLVLGTPVSEKEVNRILNQSESGGGGGRDNRDAG